MPMQEELVKKDEDFVNVDEVEDALQSQQAADALPPTNMPSEQQAEAHLSDGK